MPTPLILQLFLGALKAAIPALFSRPEGMPYLRFVMASGLRAMSFHPSYNNPGAPGTIEAYETFAKQQKFKAISVTLKSGGEGYWFGPPTATKLILYFPGGAYSNPASEGFFLILSRLVSAAREGDVEVAVFALSYDLSQKAKYPTQLQQAAGALKYLLDENKMKPHDIILGGDSAGGNLALALLSHLSHPHPNVPRVDLGGHPLRGVFLISPWVSFDYDTTSARVNKDIDMISAHGCKGASKQFLGSSEEDEYSVPLRASSEWWRGVEAQRSLITSGSYEIFASDIAAFAKKFQVHNPATEVFEAQHEIHDQGLIDGILGYETPASEKYMQRWVIKLLRE